MMTTLEKHMHKPLALQDRIIVAIRRISQAVESYSHFLLQEYDLTAPQLGTLRELELKTQATPSQLAGALQISPQTTAGILNRLEQRKLIVRSPDTEDRRRVVVRLTSAGKKLSGKAPSLLRDKFTQQLSQLEPWEQTQILSTLQRVAAMMSAAEVETMPFLGNDGKQRPQDE
jgi:DNA-binding MarR family transcriptional regulator